MYCQKCRTPVRLDSSLEDLNPAAFKLLTVRFAPEHHPDVNGARVMDAQKEYADVISRDDRLLSDKMETTARLFEILSARSDIDHPVCVECTELLLEGLQKQLSTATRERDAYIEYLRQANNDIPSAEEQQQAQKELQKALENEKALFAELERLESEKAAMDDEFSALETEARALDLEEATFWRQRNAFTSKLGAFQNERDRVSARHDHDTKQLERLQRTNVYNDTFCIGHDGYFGTINGLRLGRLPKPNVEWPEINAAWGQTCLLLATVAEKLGYTFQGYRLKPMGSTSTIEKLDSPADSTRSAKPKITVLELYHSDSAFGLGTILHSSFDNAMVAFLECLRQLGEFVEVTPARTSNGVPAQVLKMPYEIRKDKINDVSIRLKGFNTQDEIWTKACKYALTCCKYLLAHASNVSSSGKKAP
ncbi:Vacuolar protein sorting-associated protein atg6 [Coniosporium tulheliwenetii]|uniref:Vacuolar protein sorting-associated protein atg6 n=1 Tax=Coniosporium tulheliwenetii TaxID=3383036 RepID=A0ACC2ZLS5_9PEZI|nr:Vacuolar protein sorting-associated protein atg6 [Cladosporium sp. JES 115]